MRCCLLALAILIMAGCTTTGERAARSGFDLPALQLFALETSPRKSIQILHLTPAARMEGGSRVERGTLLGTVQIPPPRLSIKYHEAIRESQRLSGQRAYGNAAHVLAGAYTEEPNNPFIPEPYARALYWIDALGALRPTPAS